VQKASLPRRRLLAVLFAAGLIILLDQSADLVATLLSRRIETSAPNWRFGLFGLVAGRTSALLLGDVMVLAAVVALGWRNMLRVLAVAHLLLGVCAVAGLALFILDAAQVRGAVPADSAGVYSSAVYRAGIVMLAAAIFLPWAGIAAWRTSGTGSARR
jgi:hypothetical protein